MIKLKHYNYSNAVILFLISATLLLSSCGDICDGYFSENPTNYHYIRFEDPNQKFIDVTYQYGNMRKDVKNDSMGKNIIIWELGLDKPNCKIFIHHNMGYDTIDYTALVKKDFNPDDPCADKGIAYSLDKPIVNKHTFTNVYYVVKEVKQTRWHSGPDFEYYLTLR